MEATDILLLGIGTAGARTAYYLYQRGGLPTLRIAAVDSDPEQLAMLPSLHCQVVPPAPTLPVGSAGENARNALQGAMDKFLAQAKMMVVVTCLGGSTGDFYTQVAMDYARKKGIPSSAIVAMPHGFDSEEYKNGAAEVLDILRVQHFDVLPLNCASLGGLFPDETRENAYAQAVRWIAETAIGYLTLFTQPRSVSASSDEKIKSKAMKFDELPRGIFTGVYPTIVDHQNLDIPTYLRLTQEFSSNREEADAQEEAVSPENNGK